MSETGVDEASGEAASVESESSNRCVRLAEDSPPENYSDVKQGLRSDSGHEVASDESVPNRRPGYIYHRLLAASDAISIVLAASLASLTAGLLGRGYDVDLLPVAIAVMIPGWMLIAYWGGLYHDVEQRIDHNYVDEIAKIVAVATAWSWILLLVRSLLVVGGTDQLTPSLIWLMMIPILLLGRALVRGYARRRPWSQRAVATIGEPADVEALVRRIKRHPEWGLTVKVRVPLGRDGGTAGQSMTVSSEPGLLSTAVRGANHDVGPGKTLGEGRERELAVELDRLGIDRAFILGGALGLSARTRLVHELIETGIAVDQVSSGPETLYANSTLHHLEGMPVLSVQSKAPRPLGRAIKRFFDVVVSATGLVFISPVLVWASVRIKLDSEGPVLYRQQRCGLDNEPFDLIKFRTMVDGAHSMRPELREKTKARGNDDVLFKIQDDPRITRVGKMLRAWSIDELPQLWNVLKGDMSMVGPRPLVFEEAAEATELFAARTRMKPGIAGPWQSLGRSSIPFEDMIKLDYSYVLGWSMSEDIKLLLRTLTAVTRREGAH